MKNRNLQIFKNLYSYIERINLKQNITFEKIILLTR
jgi:hypothetical protein